MPILTDEIKAFVRNQKLCFAATVCPDGTPNLSPKGTITIWDDEHLAFANIYSPGTVNNLLINPSIEINVVDVFTRKGYRFKGVAEVVSKGKIFEGVISSYGDAGKKYPIKNIVLVMVERVLPLMSPVYDTGESEEQVKNRWVEYWTSMHAKA